MKILQCINSLSAGGAEVFTVSLCIAMKELGCEVELYTYSGAIDSKGHALEKTLADAGIPHRSSPTRSNWLKPLVPLHIAKYINEFKPDICHAHLDQSSFFMLLGARLASHKSPLIRTIHSVNALDRLPTFIQRWIANSYDANIACGPAAFEQHPFLDANDFTINNGIDLAMLAPQVEATKIRENLGIPSTMPMLVNIGSFIARNTILAKAQDIIVRAIANLPDRNIAVVFLGDGEQRCAIEGLARSLSVLPQCHFLGRVTNPADYLNAADGVLMPSRFEGLSIGCIEAVCAGRPVIASDISAFAPFKFPSTLFVQPESVDELASAIAQLLARREHFNRLAAEHQAYYCGEFDIHTVAGRYLNLCKELLTSKNECIN